MKKIINAGIIIILSFLLIWCWNETNLEQNNSEVISENNIIIDDINEPLVEEIDMIEDNVDLEDELDVLQIDSWENEILEVDWRQEIIDLQLEFGRAHVSTLDCNDYQDDGKDYCESEQNEINK